MTPAPDSRRFPAALILLALAVGLLHMAPFWRAQSQTPAGWSFTGNLTGSPDVLQYRLLTQRSQAVGPIVENRLTTEPNAPHIPMFFYYGLGKLSAWLGVPLPFVSEYAGLVFVVALVLVLFALVAHWMKTRYQTWWVFLVLLFGGGLGAHLIAISQAGPLRENLLVKRVIGDALETTPVFDLYRGHYLFTSLFDSHFLFFLLVALAAIWAFYAALRNFSPSRVLLAAFLFGAATVLHLYDGVTLVCIVLGVCFLLWRKGHAVRPLLATLGACALAVAAALLWQIALYRQAGIDIPAWRAQAIYASVLVLAYPIAWGLIAWGLGDYWRRAGLKECFLLGWALGCTVLTLAGPFYPYSDRGTLTLQIPLYLIAGAIYFARWDRVRAPAALLAVLVLAATPAFFFRTAWLNMSAARLESGRPAPYIWMSPDQHELKELLQRRAKADDVLLVEKGAQPWRTDDIWLAPEFSGKLYCGHYALTVDYERKQEETIRFFAPGDPTDRAGFLRTAGIRFVYVSPQQDPARFARVPGLVALRINSAGGLFEYRRGD